MTCPHLLSILVSLYGQDNKFKFLDFGAGNIDHFAHLNKNLPSIQYFYHDLPQFNLTIQELKNEFNLENLFVTKKLEDLQDKKLDFVFLGSALQYIKDYLETLSKIFDLGPKYIFISGQSCYQNKIDTNETFFISSSILYQMFFLVSSSIWIREKNYLKKMVGS